MENNVVETPNIVEPIFLDPPKKFIKDVRLSRLSSIYFAMCITSFVLCLLAAFSSFMIPIFYALVVALAVFAVIFMVFLVILTGGLILFAPNNLFKLLLGFVKNNNVDKVMKISENIFSSLPYLCIIGIVCAVVSIVSICFTKQKKVGKIIGLSIIVVMLALVLVFYYLMGGKLWQN